jgi:hypothetical protein
MMDEASRKEQVKRINAYDYMGEQIKLLGEASYSVVSFPAHPTVINGISLQSPIPPETMTRIRTKIKEILDAEIHLIREEQSKI